MVALKEFATFPASIYRVYSIYITHLWLSYLKFVSCVLANVTFFGLPRALSEQQLVLFIWERIWKDSGHQRTGRHTKKMNMIYLVHLKNLLNLTKLLSLPHSVGQGQDSQAEEVNGQ